MWGQNDRQNLCFSPVLIIFLLQFSCPGRLFQHDSKCYNYIFKSKHLKSVVFACSQKTFPFNLYMLGMVRNYHPISSIDIVRFCELLIHLPLPFRTVSVSYFLKNMCWTGHPLSLVGSHARFGRCLELFKLMWLVAHMSFHLYLRWWNELLGREAWTLQLGWPTYTSHIIWDAWISTEPCCEFSAVAVVRPEDVFERWPHFIFCLYCFS